MEWIISAQISMQIWKKCTNVTRKCGKIRCNWFCCCIYCCMNYFGTSVSVVVIRSAMLYCFFLCKKMLLIQNSWWWSNYIRSNTALKKSVRHAYVSAMTALVYPKLGTQRMWVREKKKESMKTNWTNNLINLQHAFAIILIISEIVKWH